MTPRKLYLPPDRAGLLIAGRTRTPSQPPGLWRGARDSNLCGAITRFVAAAFLYFLVIAVDALMGDPLLPDPAGHLVSAILAVAVPPLTARSGSAKRRTGSRSRQRRG